VRARSTEDVSGSCRIDRARRQNRLSWGRGTGLQVAGANAVACGPRGRNLHPLHVDVVLQKALKGLLSGSKSAGSLARRWQDPKWGGRQQIPISGRISSLGLHSREPRRRLQSPKGLVVSMGGAMRPCLPAGCLHSRLLQWHFTQLEAGESRNPPCLQLNIVQQRARVGKQQAAIPSRCRCFGSRRVDGSRKRPESIERNGCGSRCAWKS
jgi:hypothetical protein